MRGGSTDGFNVHGNDNRFQRLESNVSEAKARGAAREARFKF